MGERPNDEDFHLPSEDAFSDIARRRKLTPAQTSELGNVIWTAYHDFKGARASRSDRTFDRYRRQEILKALESLISHLGPGVTYSGVLSPETKEAIGLQTAPSFIEVAIEPLKVGFARALLNAENASRYYGAHILRTYLEGVRAEIEASVDQERPDLGGAEAKHARRHLIQALAEASPRILGKPATPTAKGPFVELVAAVFVACGLSCVGLDQAIRRELAARRPPSP